MTLHGTLILHAAASLAQNASVQEVTSVGGDPSPQPQCNDFFLLITLSFFHSNFMATAHRILQPTPIVFALSGQLISRVTENAFADNQQQESVGELANESKVSPNVKKDTETKHDWDVPGDSRRIVPRVSIEIHLLYQLDQV